MIQTEAKCRTESPDITPKNIYDSLKAKGASIKDDTEIFYLSLMDKEDKKAYADLKSFDPEEWDARQYYIFGIKGTRKEKQAHRQLVREHEAKRKKK